MACLGPRGGHAVSKGHRRRVVRTRAAICRRWRGVRLEWLTRIADANLWSSSSGAGSTIRSICHGPIMAARASEVIADDPQRDFQTER